MLNKCYPVSQGCSRGFLRLKLWPLGVLKPYRTPSYDVPSFLRKSTLFVFVFDSTNFPQNRRNHTNCWYRQKRWDIVWGCSIRFWNAPSTRWTSTLCVIFQLLGLMFEKCRAKFSCYFLILQSAWSFCFTKPGNANRRVQTIWSAKEEWKFKMILLFKNDIPLLFI